MFACASDVLPPICGVNITLLYFAALYVIPFIISCSSTHSFSFNTKDYMPLNIGNTWAYNDQTRSNICKRIEMAVNVETRFNKSYFKIKHSIYYKDSTAFAFSYYRLTNDSLLNLVYDPYSKRFIEIIRAIFNLQLNESKKIESSENGRSYTTLKVTNKNGNEIEFSVFPNNITDVGGWLTYKKGIGLIKSSSVQSPGIELIEYYIN
jgi:hypothetical protein